MQIELIYKFMDLLLNDQRFYNYETILDRKKEVIKYFEELEGTGCSRHCANGPGSTPRTNSFLLQYCFALISAAALPAASSASGLTVSPPAWDFGPIAADTRVEHTIILTNTGESDLSILSVSTSCHCLAAAVSTASIPPGGGAELIVSFDPRGRTGSFTDFVILRTDDPVRPVQRIRITGRIEPGEEASPGAAAPDALPPEAPPPAVESVRPAPERAAGRPPRADERGAGAAEDAVPAGAVTVLFFHSPTCPDCLRLKERFLPGLLARHPEAVVAYHDLLTERGYRALLEAERRLGREIDKTPPLAIVGRSVLAGAEAIENGLEGEIDRQRGIPIAAGQGRISVEERFKNLGLLAVAAGGLADGINPCAFPPWPFSCPTWPWSAVKDEGAASGRAGLCRRGFPRLLPRRSGAAGDP